MSYSFVHSLYMIIQGTFSSSNDFFYSITTQPQFLPVKVGHLERQQHRTGQVPRSRTVLGNRKSRFSPTLSAPLHSTPLSSASRGFNVESGQWG